MADEYQATNGSSAPTRHYGPWERVVSLLTEGLVERTPVIASRRGSVPEIIEQAKTGYIVDRPDEAVAAVESLGEIRRDLVRRHVEEHFSREQMVEKYVRVYEEVLRTQ